MDHACATCVCVYVCATQVSRVTSSGTVSESMLRMLLQHCKLDTVWKLKGAEGFGNFWATCAEPASLSSLRNLNFSYCGLTTLPQTIGEQWFAHCMPWAYTPLIHF